LLSKDSSPIVKDAVTEQMESSCNFRKSTACCCMRKIADVNFIEMLNVQTLQVFLALLEHKHTEHESCTKISKSRESNTKILLEDEYNFLGLLV
jgi:hypothetical protein